MKIKLPYRCKEEFLDLYTKHILNHIYYCPYCASLFKETSNCKYDYDNNLYYCPDCLRAISKGAKLRQDLQMHINGNIDAYVVEKHIKKIILDLEEKQFTAKDIERITLFPKELLEKIYKL